MAHIASCLHELLPFVNDNSLFIRIWQKRMHPCPMDTILVFALIHEWFEQLIMLSNKIELYVRCFYVGYTKDLLFNVIQP